MKIGFCVSGQPRGPIEIIENHQEFLNRFEAYTFMHLWWDQSHEGKVIRWHSSERFPCADMAKIRVDSYNPINYKIEDYINFDISFLRSFNYDHWGDLPLKFYQIFTPWVIYALKCQSYSVMKSTEMCLNNGECTISMRMRSDTVFTEGKAIDIFNNFKPEEGKIYFQSSMSGGHKYSGEHPSNPCDWFYCGLPKDVYKFSKTWFDSIDLLYSDGIVHANYAMKKVAELSGLDLILWDFGVIVHRQLQACSNSPEDPYFVHWQKYLDDFNSDTMSVVKNLNEWPHWVKYVDFNQCKNLK